MCTPSPHITHAPPSPLPHHTYTSPHLFPTTHTPPLTSSPSHMHFPSLFLHHPDSITHTLSLPVQVWCSSSAPRETPAASPSSLPLRCPAEVYPLCWLDVAWKCSLLPSLFDYGHVVDPRRGPTLEWQKDPEVQMKTLHKVEIIVGREGERERRREGWSE